MRQSRQGNSIVAKQPAPAVLTIGHSTRLIDDFLTLLTAHGVRRVVDVRTVPRSRHNPQFNHEELAKSLKKAGINYELIPGLGGLRHPRRGSVNTGWRNSSFRGYADYMQTPEFAQSIQKLIAIATKERTAIMCAEAVPWRCHRSLIADALLTRGISAEHIMSATRRTAHSLTSFAKIRGTTVTYPASNTSATQSRTEASDRTSRRPRAGKSLRSPAPQTFRRGGRPAVRTLASVVSKS
jgi:uncharacterized protein (DUF488 family)